MTASSYADNQAHAKPDPVKVAQITASHGADAARMRWYWVPSNSLSHIAAEGRRILNARAGVSARPSRRPISPEQEDALVATVMAGGGTSRAAVQHGISEMLVRSILQERGITEWPRVSHTERAAASHATRRARRGIAAPVEAAPDVVPISIPDIPVPEAVPVMSMAAQNDDLRPERGSIPVDADVVRADHERHGGCAQSMADEYGVPCASVNRRLREIGLLKAKPSRSDSQPEVKPDWPAYEASLPAVTPPTAQSPVAKRRLGTPGIPGRPEPLQDVDRLSVADLALAIELSRLSRCEPETAIAFLRADRDASVMLQATRF